MTTSDSVPPGGAPPQDADHGSGAGGKAQQVTDTAQAEARELADSAGQEVRSVGETAQQQASRVAGEAREQARNLFSSATASVEEQAEQQVHRLADVLHSAGAQTRALAEGRPEEAGEADQYIRELASTLSDVASRIDRLGARGSVEELQHFARRRPGVFLAGAAVAGFVASRFLRNAGEGGGASADVQQRDALPPATPSSTATPARPVAPPSAPPSGPTTPGEPAGQNRGGPTAFPEAP